MSTAEITRLLSDLVSIRSVNPRLRGALPTDGERNAGDYVASFLARHGVEVELQEVAAGRHNVIGHIERGPRADDRVILISAHMDTYPDSDQDAREFEPRVEDGFLVGRGSADAKASLAAMLASVVNVRDRPDRREAYIVASIDEEHGLCGCRALCSHSMRPDLAITGEPTSLVPIYAQKGIVRAGIHLAGEPHHAAYPGGQNPLYAAARAMVLLQEFNERLAALPDPRRMGPATITPTRVESDGDMNLTPQSVRIWFDARILPGQTEEAFLHDLRTYLEARLEWKFAVEAPYFSSPPNACATDHPLVQELFSKIEAITGSCAPQTFSYGSEAGVLSSIATAALVFGPGDPRYSHGPGERVRLEEVEAASRIYAQILTSAAA